MHDSVRILERGAAPRVLPFGDGFVEARLPEGTRVVYANPPLEPLPDPDAAIRRALLHPTAGDPLIAKLRPGMKVTIGIDDISLPLPPMQTPDVRERVLTVVLDLLADYGVDDVHLVVATSLHRRLTAAEIRRMVGTRIFRAFYPDRLYNHDAEAPDGLVELGRTEHGERVLLNRRAAESDLLVYVNIDLVPMDGGHKSVCVGLSGYESLRSHHNPTTMLDCHSYMDPRRSALHDSCGRMGRIVDGSLDVFTVETALNTQMFPPEMDFLSRCEDEWGEADRLKWRALRWTAERLPAGLRRAALQRFTAPYGVIGVWAGPTGPTHEAALERVFEQYAVPVEGQSDVLVAGVPYICPYNVNSIMNPILVQCTGLGYLFNFYRGQPLVRRGGTLILAHPLPDAFQAEHHPSYVEFFDRVLPATRNSFEMEKRFEEEFAKNPVYRHMYRHGHAYHGVHPFYMWYWGDAGRAHVGRVIVAGAEDSDVAALLGFETAPGVEEAVAMARGELGPSASVTCLHAPPILIADVA
jgi:hypothetical protein